MSDVTFGAVLRRGAISGVIAGVLAAIVSLSVTERVIDRALDIEEAREAAEAPAAAGHSHEEPLVSRDWQVFGGGLAAILAGLCFGIIFAVVLAKVRHRLPGRTDFGRAMSLAGLAFFAVALFPALKYPSNPPAVGDPDTIDERTLDYLLVLAVGIAVAALALMISAELEKRRFDSSVRIAVTIGAVVVMLTVAFLLLPDNPDSIASDVPADLIWDFRLASLAELGALWLGLGVATGLLLDHGREARRRRLAAALG